MSLANLSPQADTRKTTRSPQTTTASQKLPNLFSSPVTSCPRTNFPLRLQHPSLICRSQKLVYEQMTSRSQQVKGLRKHKKLIPSWNCFASNTMQSWVHRKINPELLSLKRCTLTKGKTLKIASLLKIAMTIIMFGRRQAIAKTGERPDHNVRRRVDHGLPSARFGQKWRPLRHQASRQPSQDRQRWAPSRLESSQLQWLLRYLVRRSRVPRWCSLRQQPLGRYRTRLSPRPLRARLKHKIIVAPTRQLACCRLTSARVLIVGLLRPRRARNQLQTRACQRRAVSGASWRVRAPSLPSKGATTLHRQLKGNKELFLNTLFNNFNACCVFLL